MTLRIGVIGLGHWGPNLTRCCDALPDSRIVAICDRDRQRLEMVSAKFPKATAMLDDALVLDRNLVDAVVIAAPTAKHFALARRALISGLHVFVEKPLATSSAECQELIELAERRKLVLFVGHVFLHSAPVIKLTQLVEQGELGDVCYISSSRLNLGPVRQDVNVLWDLAPHDVSIMLQLISAEVESVACSGLAYLNARVHDVSSMTIHFADKKMGLIHVSWIDPHKRRLMTVVGSKRMAVYDDIEPIEKIKIYDQGVEMSDGCDSFGEFQYSYRYGDIHTPRLDLFEPLKAECQSFVDAVCHAKRPLTDGQNGLEVVRIIEAANRSLLNGNERVPIAK